MISEENGRSDLEIAGVMEDTKHTDEDEENVCHALPPNHRFMHIDRLNIFSDALFATIATFMIVPLKEDFEGFDVNENLWDSLAKEWYRFLFFVISFFIISTLWQDHVWILQRVEHVGDLGLLLNVLLLLITSVIPFLAALIGDFYLYALIWQMFGACLLALHLVQLMMILLAFRRGKMLEEDFAEDKAKVWLRVDFVTSACSKIVLSALTIGLAVVSLPATFAVLFLLMFTDWICIIIVAVYRRFTDSSLNKSVRRHLWGRFVLEHINLDRTQTFTDGVFIIVATLIILDITAESLVSIGEDTSEDELFDKLLEQKEPLLAYISTFITIGMIWYINYSMCHFLKRLSRLLLMLNRLTLLFVSVVPLGFQLVSKYDMENTTRNENRAVQFHSFLIFCAAISQLTFWGVAHWKPQKHFASNYNSLQGKRIICLLLVYPIITVVLFCAAFSQAVFKAHIIHAVELSIPLFFVTIKLVFEVLQHRENLGSGSPGRNVAMVTRPSQGDEDKVATVVQATDVDTHL